MKELRTRLLRVTPKKGKFFERTLSGKAIRFGYVRFRTLPGLSHAPCDQQGVVVLTQSLLDRGIETLERFGGRRKLHAPDAAPFQHRAEILAHAVEVESDVGAGALEYGNNGRRTKFERVGSTRALVEDFEQLCRREIEIAHERQGLAQGFPINDQREIDGELHSGT